MWWFCNQIGRHFHLENAINQYWSGKIITERCHYYFEECLLPQLDTNLVVGLDEIDRVFPHQEIAQDFLGLVRFWFEKAKSIDATGKLWKRFNLVLVHSTEVYIPLPINQSPFNVGMAIDLRPFNYREVQELSQLHRLDFSEENLQQLIKLLGGHPFLLRLAFYEIQCENQTLETILETAHTEAGIYSDHLGRHLWNLQRHPELLAAFEQVIDEESIQLEQSLAFKLKSMGLVHYQGNRVTVSCNLYRLYFTERLTA